MKLDISIRNVQHVKKVDFSVDLADKSLVCITGKNGSGKTTLIKAIGNLIQADTFPRTSGARTFGVDSEIHYQIGGKSVVFTYDKGRKVLESKGTISNTIKRQLSVELPIPHGERFNFFKKISDIDEDLRRAVVLGKHTKPSELIEFLKSIYATEKFDNLVEILVKNVPYYVIPHEDNYYLREDYFSSGEYFLISLYRRIRSRYLAIFIDEIDISLDAAAQVRLVEWLKTFSATYGTKFVFTTHSLAMMRTISDELFHMEEQNDGTIVIEQRSYAFVKSTLFGFKGWDRYILTEDEVLRDFLTHLLQRYCKPSFYQLKIIHVGGGTNTTNLLERNKTEHFFSNDPKSVMVVLDGDQKKLAHSKKDNIYCIPMESVEKELLTQCLNGEFWDTKKFQAHTQDHQRLSDFLAQKNTGKRQPLKIWFYSMVLKLKKGTYWRRKLSVAKAEPVKAKEFSDSGKRLFHHLVKTGEFTKQEIFDAQIKKYPKEMVAFQRILEDFTDHKATNPENQTLPKVPSQPRQAA